MNGMEMQPAAGDWLGWAVVVVGTVATIWTIGASIYWIVKPGELEPSHAKNLILRKDR